MPFQKAISVLTELERVRENSFKEALKLDWRKLTDMIGVRMLKSGTYADGESIAPSYSELTINIKEMNNQESEFVTLTDTGEYHLLTQLDITSNGFELTNDDINELQKKYGDSQGQNLLDLSDDEVREFYIDFVIPIIQRKIRNAYSRA